MRMWMVDPKLLCRKHLLGEHGEIHKHRHCFEKGYSIKNRIGQIEPEKMEARHNILADEMIRRGYNHRSPYCQPDLSKYDLTDFVVDTRESLQDLESRCSDCASLIHQHRD